MSFLTKEVTLPKLRLPQLTTPTFRPPRRSAPTPRVNGVVGLEIGATQAIAAQARLEDGRIVAEQVAARPLAPGLVRNGLVVDGDALVAELRELFAEHKLGRRVRVGLATPRTILRVIDLPPLDEADVRIALPMQAQDRIPMPLERAVLDHQTVGLVDTPEGQRLRVIVVATEREPVDTLLGVLRSAGLRPEGIDLSVFAAMRAVSGAAPEEGPVLYAQLGDLVNLAIADSGVCKFTRQAPQGLGLVLERLAEQRGGSLQDAHALLLAAAGDDQGQSTREDISEVGALLARVATELGSELRAAAEFYGNQSGQSVGHGIVTGALAPLTGFVPALTEASGLDLISGEATVADDGALGGCDPRVAAVAVGLAVGRLS